MLIAKCFWAASCLWSSLSEDIHLVYAWRNEREEIAGWLALLYSLHICSECWVHIGYWNRAHHYCWTADQETRTIQTVQYRNAKTLAMQERTVQNKKISLPLGTEPCSAGSPYGFIIQSCTTSVHCHADLIRTVCMKIFKPSCKTQQYEIGGIWRYSLAPMNLHGSPIIAPYKNSALIRPSA